MCKYPIRPTDHYQDHKINDEYRPKIVTTPRIKVSIEVTEGGLFSKLSTVSNKADHLREIISGKCRKVAPSNHMEMSGREED